MLQGKPFLKVIYKANQASHAFSLFRRLSLRKTLSITAHCFLSTFRRTESEDCIPASREGVQISACLRPKSCKLRERVLTKPVKGIQGAILPCGTTRKLHGDQIATKDQTQLFLSSKTWKQQEKSWDFPNGPMTCTWASSIVGGRSVAFNDVTSCALMQSAAVLKFP